MQSFSFKFHFFFQLIDIHIAHHTRYNAIRSAQSAQCTIPNNIFKRILICWLLMFAHFSYSYLLFLDLLANRFFIIFLHRPLTKLSIASWIGTVSSERQSICFIFFLLFLHNLCIFHFLFERTQFKLVNFDVFAHSHICIVSHKLLGLGVVSKSKLLDWIIQLFQFRFSIYVSLIVPNKETKEKKTRIVCDVGRLRRCECECSWLYKLQFKMHETSISGSINHETLKYDENAAK